MWRRFKSVSRAGNMLYWDCPNKCGSLHKIELPLNEPKDYLCKCGLSYQILKVTSLNIGGARLLFEIQE